MNALHEQFIQDMTNAGLEVRPYEGRWFYRGPSVTVPYLQDALQETRVPCNHDSMGLGYVVHPNQRCVTDDEWAELQTLLAGG